MDIAEKIHEFKRLKLEIADLKKSADEIEDAIKQEMKARDVTEMVVDVFKVNWMPYSTTRIDVTALKAELPDIAARYSITTQSQRFSIL